MRVLLLEANQASRWVGGRVGPRVHVVPAALLGLAAFVRQALPETEVLVVESSLEAATDEGLGQLLKDFRPDWVGIRSVNFFLDEVRRIVTCVRTWRPVPLIVGGPIGSALRERLFDLVPGLELVAVGEGENTLVRLLAGESPETIPGLWIRSTERVTGTGPAHAPTQLDELPWPDYSLVDWQAYAGCLSYAYNQRRQGVLMTSRGCPYQCTYCFQVSRGPVRWRSAPNVLAEIEHLVHAHGIRDFYVVDDIFNLHPARALELMDLLTRAELGIRLYFVNGLQVDRCDREMLERMQEAGTVWITFGIETAHPRIARMIRKELDLDRARDLIGYAQSLGLVVNVDTMFGFPTETADDARVTLDWLATLPHPSLLPYHFNLRGYEGTAIVEQAVAAGWDREAFLATGYLSYHDLPSGTPTFSRSEMLAHCVEYQRRFGLGCREHVAWSVRTLSGIGYSDAEVCDMYSVLINRRVRSVQELG
ncbi:B12-binding domain-containing radical SAM protein [Myxococcota bacterium]